MVIVTGERCSTPVASSWLKQIKGQNSTTPSQAAQEVFPAGVDILWALNSQGVFTLFECHNSNDFDLKNRCINRTVAEVFRDFPAVIDAAKQGLAGKPIETVIDWGGLKWKIQGYPIYSDGSIVSSLVGFAHKISQLETIHSAQQSILGIIAALHQARNYSEMPAIILQQTIRLFNPDGVLLAVCVNPNHEMSIEVASGLWNPLAGLRSAPLIDLDHSSDLCFFTDDDIPAVLRAKANQNVVALPLIAQDSMVGVLWISHQQPLKPDGTQLLRVCGDIIANAIHRIQQNETTQHHLQRLAVLHDIDRTITQNTDLKVTLQNILGHVITHLKVDAAVIFLLNSNNWQMEVAADIGIQSQNLPVMGIRLDEVYQKHFGFESDQTEIRGAFRFKDPCSLTTLIAREGFFAHFGIPLVIRGQVKGILAFFHRQPLDPDDEWLSFLEILATQTAIAVDNAELFKGLQHSNTELTLAYETALEGWVKALDLRDEETEWHTQRVTEMTLCLAEAMGMDSDELLHIRRGALLHDIGKMGISDNILNKDGSLSQKEWVMMRQHPVYAKNLLAPIAYLHPSLDIPYYHHEKWDGSGYPDGLIADAIPLAARIFAVVDVWDALRSDRPYRPAWSLEKARQYIRQQSGKHFDPMIVEKFFELGLDHWDR